MLEEVRVNLVPVKGNCKTTACKDIFINCVLSALRQKFGEKNKYNCVIV